MVAKTHGGDPNHPLFPHGKPQGYKKGCRCTTCLEAGRLKRQAYSQKNSVRIKQYNKQYWMNPEKRAKQLLTPSRQKEYRRNWQREYYKNTEFRARKLSLSAARKAAKRLSLTGNIDLIRRIYEACPEGFHVDHIIPLAKGGEHHENNLQYLRADVNIRKKDKLDFDYSPYPGCRIPWQSVLNV